MMPAGAWPGNGTDPLRQSGPAMTPSYILTLSCPDKPGIVHAVSGFLLERGGNIEEAAQYNDHATGLFFMRVQFTLLGADVETLRTSFARVAGAFAMSWQIHDASVPTRTASAKSVPGCGSWSRRSSSGWSTSSSRTGQG